MIDFNYFLVIKIHIDIIIKFLNFIHLFIKVLINLTILTNLTILIILTIPIVIIYLIIIIFLTVQTALIVHFILYIITILFCEKSYHHKQESQIFPYYHLFLQWEPLTYRSMFEELILDLLHLIFILWDLKFSMINLPSTWCLIHRKWVPKIIHNHLITLLIPLFYCYNLSNFFPHL